MRENRLKALWAEGRPALNAWCSMPGAFSAELMAHHCWDTITIDTQHGLIGYSEMLAMLQAVSTTPVVPLVRVSWNQPGEIMRALDAGAYGVICPMINTPDECADFVRACRYPPDGYRSSGPTRAAVYGGGDYQAYANREVATFAMIETADGLTHVDAIVATPGLDAVYIGPSDLSLALGGPPGQDSDAPALMAAFDRILSACKAAGVKVGVHCASPDYARRMIERGFDLVTAGADTRYMAVGKREAAEMREWLKGR